MAIIFFFRRFWVKEPRHSENISDEMYYTYLSTRRVEEKTMLLFARCSRGRAVGL